MNVLKKLTIKDLKLNKKRTIVTIIGIMLSVALITAVATMFQSFIDSMIKYEKRQKGDYHVSFRDVPYEEVVNIKNNRSVEDTYLVENVGYAVLSDSKNEYKPYAFVMGFTDESEKKLGINLVEGRFPENENEIAVDRMHADNVGIKTGDTITVGDQKFEVVGRIAYVNYATLHEKPTDLMFDALKFDVAMVTQEGFDRLTADVHYAYAWKYQDIK